MLLFIMFLAFAKICPSVCNNFQVVQTQAITGYLLDLTQTETGR